MMRFFNNLSISRKFILCLGSIIVMAPGAHVVLPSEADMAPSTTWSKTHGDQARTAAPRRAMPAHPAEAAPRRAVGSPTDRPASMALRST